MIWWAMEMMEQKPLTDLNAKDHNQIYYIVHQVVYQTVLLQPKNIKNYYKILYK